MASFRVYVKPQFRIEIRTGDAPPAPEWIEMEDEDRRYRFVDHESAVRALARLKRFQPHSELRISQM